MTKRVYAHIDEEVYDELEKMANNMLKMGEIEANSWTRNPINLLLRHLIMEKVGQNLATKWNLHPDLQENKVMR